MVGLVSCTLPFGWKESAFVYQTLGAAVSDFLRNEGIPCSIYIDDRFTGELMASSGPWSVPGDLRPRSYGERAAQTAIFLVCATLISLGYVLGLSKCSLIPVTSLEFLGLIVDSERQAFQVPALKREKFADLRESILRVGKKVAVKMLQRFQGKCVRQDLPGRDLALRDYWSPEELNLHISTKETLAVLRILQATPPQVQDCRIALKTDSQVLGDT